METGREQEKKTEKLEVNPRYDVCSDVDCLCKRAKKHDSRAEKLRVIDFFGVGIDFRRDRPAALRISLEVLSFAPKGVSSTGGLVKGTFVLDILEVNFNGAAGGHDRCPRI